MTDQNEGSPKKLALDPNDLDLESLSISELDQVAGGQAAAGDSYTCPQSYTCPGSYTCPESYTCPPSYTCPATQ
jgi:hypothetical protein